MARKKNWKHGVKRATIYSILAVILIAVIVPSGVVLVDAWNEKIKDKIVSVWSIDNVLCVDEEIGNGANYNFIYMHTNSTADWNTISMSATYPNETLEHYVNFVTETTHSDEHATNTNYLYVFMNYSCSEMMDKGVTSCRIHFNLLGNYTFTIKSASNSASGQGIGSHTYYELYDNYHEIASNNTNITVPLKLMDIVAGKNKESTYNAVRFIITPGSKDYDILPNTEVHIQLEFLAPSGTGVLNRFGGMDGVYGVFGALLIIMSIFCTPFVNPTKRDKMTLTPWKKKNGSYRTSKTRSYRKPRTRSYKKRRSGSYRSRRY